MWQEPKTDWSEGDRFTYEDMNRITGNIAYLHPGATIKTDWTQNDIISATDWEEIQSEMTLLIQTSGLNESVPDDTMTAATMNDVETLTEQLYSRIGLNIAQKIANVYPAEQTPVYANEVAENYVRGI